ncbi:MAG: type II secretion system F family protein [Blastocatellia bacterium]|nr:type II secretion system F family protein [Blastocatellia bacterium]
MASYPNAQKTSATKADIEAYERRVMMELPLTELLRVLTRLASNIEAGVGIADFVRDEVKKYDLMEQTAPSSRAFMLSGRPGAAAGPFMREMAHMMCDLGFDFSKATAQFPGIFDQHLQAVLKAAEKTGDYAPVLRRYCDNLRQRQATRDAIINALSYPVIVLAVAVTVISLFMVMVVPAFKMIYAGLLGPNEQFPPLTEFVIGCSDFVVGHWAVLALLVGLPLGGYLVARKRNRNLRFTEDKLWLRIPVVGTLIAQLEMVNFLTTFIMLIRAGAILTESAELAADAIANGELREAAQKGADVFRMGHVSTLAKALATQDPIFSPASSFYTEMTNFEQTGSLENLERYAELLQHNADQTRQRLLGLLTPVTIIFLSGLVGGLVVALYLPLIQLIGKLAGGPH